MDALDLHPMFKNRRFTLRGVFATEHDAAVKAGRLNAEGFRIHEFRAPSPRGNVLHFVAAHHNVEPDPRAAIPHQHTADWEATRMAIQVFRDNLRAARKGGRVTRWYKGLDVEALHGCIRRYRWDGTRLDVAGWMVSSTILVHPFPNANHRTSFALARLYLAAEGVPWPGYDLRGRGAARLFRDTHGFYRDSKYILQLLRHRDLVRVAFEEGYTHLRVGDNTDAPIRRADLEVSAEELRLRHLGIANGVIHGLSDARARRNLSQPSTHGLRSWVHWYQG